MRYYEEELETLIKAGAKVVEVASFEWKEFMVLLTMLQKI